MSYYPISNRLFLAILLVDIGLYEWKGSSVILFLVVASIFIAILLSYGVYDSQ